MKKDYRTALFRKVVWQSVIWIVISGMAGMLTLDRARLSANITQASIRSESEIPSVSVDQVHYGVSQEKIICIDARSSAEFAKGHVPGSISLPLEELDQVLAKNLDLFVQNKPIVIYCGGSGCALSHLLARKLAGMGIDQTSVFTSGWIGWKSAGLPIEQ